MIFVINAVFAMIRHDPVVVEWREAIVVQEGRDLVVIVTLEHIRVPGKNEQSSPDAVADHGVLILSFATEGRRSELQHPVLGQTQCSISLCISTGWLERKEMPTQL